MRPYNKNEFWVINVSKRNVALSDLALTIPSGRVFNLLDEKHFSYTIDQLNKSVKEGSLYKKRDKILLCEDKPKFAEPKQKELSQQPMIIKPRSAVKVTIPKYDELIFSDEQYAEEISELFSDSENTNKD